MIYSDEILSMQSSVARSSFPCTSVFTVTSTGVSIEFGQVVSVGLMGHLAMLYQQLICQQAFVSRWGLHHKTNVFFEKEEFEMMFDMLAKAAASISPILSDDGLHHPRVEAPFRKVQKQPQ